MYIRRISYFLHTYGHKRGLTVLHRMRTWYNHQARVNAAHGNDGLAAKYQDMAESLTAYIVAWPSYIEAARVRSYDI